MAGVAVAFEEPESDVAATAAVAASRRTNTRNNFLDIRSVLPLKTRLNSLIEKILVPGIGQTAAKFLSSDCGFPVLGVWD